ncbi:sigma-70 family RNA polymerase sigma factor [Oceanobacillus sp. CAU 1775]
MKVNTKTTFEEIVKQNEKRIYYQLRRLGIRDYEGEFYAEGLYAMWMAYEKYDVNKGPMATYFSFSIRNRMIDLIRKKVNEREKEEIVIKEVSQINERIFTSAIEENSITSLNNQVPNDSFWRQVFSTLTMKQKKWVYYAVICDLSQKEIAEKEGVTVEAVKGWSKEAKRKLRKLWLDLEQMSLL